MQDSILVEVVRAGQVESRHFVSFAISTSKGQLIGSWGDPGLVTFLRSSAKPLQAIPLVEGGAADHYKFGAREIALICASHSGTDMHVEQALHLLEMIGEPKSALQCGIHAPYDEETYRSLLSSGIPVDSLRNNCSGKHAGMLGLAKYLDTSLDDYLSPEHPVQLRILQVIADMAALPVESVIVGIDGCSAPTFAIPLHAAARAYARLVDYGTAETTRSAAGKRIVEAMTRFPEYIAGPGRFDTILMRAVNGRIVCKSGAEGFQAIGIPRGGLGREAPALGIAIKVHDGDHRDHHAAALIAIELVDRLGGFRAGERAHLAPYDAGPRKNLRGLRVGEIRIHPDFEKGFDLVHEWI